LEPLDGEGVFQPFEFLFQRLDAPSVVGEDALLNSVQPGLDPLDVLFTGGGFEAFIDHAGQVLDSGWCVFHISSSIILVRGVSSSMGGMDFTLC
jgi:hypothetical protein